MPLSMHAYPRAAAQQVWCQKQPEDLTSDPSLGQLDLVSANLALALSST